MLRLLPTSDITSGTVWINTDHVLRVVRDIGSHFTVVTLSNGETWKITLSVDDTAKVLNQG